MKDLIILDWRQMGDRNGRWSERWDYTCALRVVHPEEDEILYIGKVDGSTVRQRWNADDKHNRVWQRMEEERGLYEHTFIIGEFRMSPGWRLTRELGCDGESLLIYKIKPWANKQINNLDLVPDPAWHYAATGTGRLSARCFVMLQAAFREVSR